MPPGVLRELAELMKPPARREGHSEKVRRYSRVIREARAYAAEFADAPNRHGIDNVLLAALQARMNLESDGRTYEMLLETAERIVGSGAPRGAKLEADLVLVRRHIAESEPEDAAFRRLAADFAGRYQRTEAAAKALMYASMLAEAEGNKPLVDFLRIELVRRPDFWDRPGVTGFLRRSTDFGLSGRTFNAALARLDGSTLHAPRDLLGKSTIVLFWAADDRRSTEGIERLKAFYNNHSDKVEVVGVSLDDDRADLVRFAKAHDLPWPQTFSGRGLNDPAAWTYGVDSLPSALMVDPNGRLRHIKGLVGWYGKKPDTAFNSYGGLVGQAQADMRAFETLHDAVHGYLSGEFLATMKVGPLGAAAPTAGVPAESMRKLRRLVEAIRFSPDPERKTARARAAMELADALLQAHPDAEGAATVRNVGIVASRVLWLKRRDPDARARAVELAGAVAREADPSPATVLADFLLTDRRLVDLAGRPRLQREQIDAFLARHADGDARTPAAILASLLAVTSGHDALIRTTSDALAADHAHAPEARSFLRYVLGRFIDRGAPFDASLERMDGRPLNLPEALEGRPAVVCFWDAASMRDFRSLPEHPRRHHPVYSGLNPDEHEDLLVIGVNLDDSAETADDAIRGHMTKWLHTRPTAGWRHGLLKTLDVQQLPSFWIIGRNGRIAADDALAAHARSGVLAAAMHQPPPDLIRARTVNRWRVLGPFHQRTDQQYTETGYVAPPDWVRTDAAAQAWLNMPWQRSRWFGDQLERRFSRTNYPPARAELEVDFSAKYDDGGGDSIGWSIAEADAYGELDLNKVFPHTPKTRIAYAVAYVHSATGGRYPLALTNTDAITLRVNGREVVRLTGQRITDEQTTVWPVMSRPSPGALESREHSPMPMQRGFMDRDWRTVELRKGWNELWIKTAHVRSQWRLQLRFHDPRRTLRYALAPNDSPDAYAGALPGWAPPTTDEPTRALAEQVDGPVADAVVSAAAAFGDFGHPARHFRDDLKPYWSRPCLDPLTLLAVLHALDVWEPTEALRQQFPAADKANIVRTAFDPDRMFERLSDALTETEAAWANVEGRDERRRQQQREALFRRMRSLVDAIGGLDDPRAARLVLERLKARAPGKADDQSPAKPRPVPLGSLVHAAGRLGDPALLDALRPFLASDHRGFLRNVIRAMLAIGPRGHEAELIDAIDNAEWRGFVTTQMVARVGGEQARRRIIKTVANSFQHGMPSHEASKRHVENLARFRDPEVVPEIARFLEHDDQRIRQQAIEALGALGHANATPALLEALDEPTNGELRHFIAAAIGDIGDPRAADALADLMDARAYGLRILAARALGSLDNLGDGPAAFEALTDGLDDPHWLVRASAAESLGRRGDNAAVQPLVKALGDPNADVRANAATALGRLGAKDAVEPLVQRLDDWPVRRAALAAIERLGAKPGPGDGARGGAASPRSRALMAIAAGRADAVEQIAQTLGSTDDPAIADAMLNSGHARLRAAAAEWAGRRGYRIVPQRGAAIVRWAGEADDANNEMDAGDDRAKADARPPSRQ